jgi:predicted ArsR family transcriptional regulator
VFGNPLGNWFMVLSSMADRVHPSWLDVLTDPVRLDVLLALSAARAGSAAEIACMCHASERTVKRHLDTLVVLGLARVGRPRGDERSGRTPRRFVLDAAVKERTDALVELLSKPLSPA